MSFYKAVMKTLNKAEEFQTKDEMIEDVCHEEDERPIIYHLGLYDIRIERSRLILTRKPIPRAKQMSKNK